MRPAAACLKIVTLGNARRGLANSSAVNGASDLLDSDLRWTSASLFLAVWHPSPYNFFPGSGNPQLWS